MKGIDVSVWNGSNDFDRAKADGVDFVIIRSNYGYNDNFKNKGYDSYFEENYKGCKNAGLPIGVYCYNYAQTIEQAKQEAYRTLNCIKGKSIDIAVFCDAEDKYFAQGDNVTDKIIAYLKIIKEAGYKVGVYANLNWFTNYINLNRIKSELGEVITWIAHYNKSIFKNNPNHYKGSYDIWQYGSEGYYVDGVSNYGNGIGYVDTNISYIDFVKGWIRDNVGWWYRNNDGSYPTNSWKQINDNWFYFGERGYAYQNRWLKYKNEWYYFDENCYMVCDKFINIGNETFYLNAWGTCHLNYTRVINGKQYAFNERGALIRNKIINGDGVIE